MGDDKLTASATETADLSGNVAKRLLRYFRAQVEDWHDVCRHLSDWEDPYLVDAPTPEHLAEHRRLLVELEQVGRWLALATQSPDFPDRATAELANHARQNETPRRRYEEKSERQDQAPRTRGSHRRRSADLSRQADVQGHPHHGLANPR